MESLERNDEKSLILKELATGYENKGKRILISENISAEMKQGSLISLLGPNGAGKSTLLKTICGFLPALSGSIMICAKELHAYKKEELARTLSIVTTERPALMSTNVKELVSMGRTPYTGFMGRLTAEDNDIVDKAMRLTGVESMADRRVGTLSDGELQKTMIAKAIAQDTPVILLDEPSAFLDFPSKVELMLLLRRLAQDEQKCILLSTHDLNIALELSHSLFLIDKKIGYAMGSPEELADKGIIERYFNSKDIKFYNMAFHIIK